jgi:hypothetical protein
MTIEIRDASLEAGIRKQLQATLLQAEYIEKASA